MVVDLLISGRKKKPKPIPIDQKFNGMYVSGCGAVYIASSPVEETLTSGIALFCGSMS